MGVRLLGRYTVVPRDLFRISAGSLTKLRDKSLRPGAPSWDVMTIDGKVQPLGMTSDWYQRPNGASLRPNTKTQQSLVRSFRAPVVLIYHILQGTTLPEDLILIHERGEHYSLQASREMTLDELNSEVTSFLNDEAIRMTKKEWHAKFPTRTDQ
ncbi:uncharacterized protein PV06_10313 [Exophiala oligosperma]|uniref:Tse2 ADP-ribosyltransferase toxin domain-containing protein n=1 Tax=Exophiala oligosperma TaxID=215243 RepID=A0A0D2ABG5_9EURO|nr:uncharacterized protein PV06_10313 [Exophiala oligosperma]KIW37676.1 hypothetical protein PV06_10313 [Exophiala oligosperma]